MDIIASFNKKHNTVEDAAEPTKCGTVGAHLDLLGTSRSYLPDSIPNTPSFLHDLYLPSLLSSRMTRRSPQHVCLLSPSLWAARPPPLPQADKRQGCLISPQLVSSGAALSHSLWAAQLAPLYLANERCGHVLPPSPSRRATALRSLLTSTRSDHPRTPTVPHGVPH